MCISYFILFITRLGVLNIFNNIKRVGIKTHLLNYQYINIFQIEHSVKCLKYQTSKNLT